MGYKAYGGDKMGSPMKQKPIKTIHESDSLYNRNKEQMDRNKEQIDMLQEQLASLGAKQDSLGRDFNTRDSIYKADIQGPAYDAIIAGPGDDPRQSEIEAHNAAVEEYKKKHQREE